MATFWLILNQELRYERYDGYISLHVGPGLQVEPCRDIIARCVDMESALHEVEQAAIEKLLGG